jgi:hypothetical protein
MRPPPHKLFNYRALLIFKAFGYLFFSMMSHTVIDTIEFEVVVVPRRRAVRIYGHENE